MLDVQHLNRRLNLLPTINVSLVYDHEGVCGSATDSPRSEDEN